jgi:alpha-N-acetylglucosamine transferase
MAHYDWAAITIIVGLSTSITAFMISVVSYFMKKWMGSVEKQHELSADKIAEVAKTTAIAVADLTKTTAAAVAEVAKTTAIAVAEVAKTTAAADIKVAEESKTEIKILTTEIKQDIRDSRNENLRISAEIKGSIDKLAEHQAVANGRTGKLEGAIEKVTTLCEERSRAFYAPK